MAREKASAATDNTPASAASASVPNSEGTDIPNEQAPATPTAVEIASAAVAQIETALAVLATDNPAHTALTAALDTARGTLALAEAEAALMAQKAAEIEAATVAASALPAELLTAMLDAIERKYAPAPPEAPAEAEAPATYGRKQPSARTIERNSAAVAVLASDTGVQQRVADTHNAFKTDWSGLLIGVSATAGTRYLSLTAFAGAGVANRADYMALVPQLRAYLLQLGYAAGGASVASDAWLFAFGPHASNGPKAADTLRLKFSNRAEVALHADGRFRLTAPNTAGVRYVRTDATALAVWTGTVASQHAPEAPQNAPEAPATTPAAPTPPTTVALANGQLAQTARCQHCTARNVIGQPACNACGAADWQA